MTRIKTMTNMYDNRANVTELQIMLREISKIRQGIKFINPDGLFLGETADAVAAVQELSGLEPNGRVDFDTWKAIAELVPIQ